MRRRFGVGRFLLRWSARFGKRNRACVMRCFCSIRNRFVKFTWCRISSAKDISRRLWFRAELELNGRITKRSNGQIWRYSEPVGNHPLMTELLLKRARDVAPDAAPAETSLLIVAHGTDLNENSAVAAKREAEKIRALGNTRLSSMFIWKNRRSCLSGAN